MWRKPSLISTLAICLLAAPLPAAPADAGEVERELTRDRPRALVAADALNLRAEPSLDAEIVGQVRRAWPVAVMDDAGPSVLVDGRQDRWTFVATFQCTDDPCRHFQAGWVVDSYLAFNDRYEPLTGWPAATITGYDGWSAFTYTVTPDGAFIRWRLPCVAAACDPTPAAEPSCYREGESPQDGVCVLSGTLHRYRGLVIGRIEGPDRQGPILFVDESGELCALESERDDATRMCERSGPYVSAGPDPRAALAAVAEDRRQRLALTAADMLNLRAEPSANGEVIGRLPRASAVVRLDDAGRQTAIGGRADHWVRIKVTECYSYDFGSCEAGATGWVVDSFLAYQDRLEAVTAWRVGSIGAYGGDYGFGYDIAADGTLVSWETCGDYNDPEMCTETGRLYRYRDLVVAKADNGSMLASFYVGEGGRLCLPDPGPEFEYDNRCDR